MPPWGYYAYAIGEDGHIQNHVEVHCDNDEEARGAPNNCWTGTRSSYGKTRARLGRFSLKDSRLSSPRCTEPKAQHIRRLCMCSQCRQIDAKIERLRYLAGRILDQQTIEGITQLITELETQKATLHPK
jgi:hypothetical protein